LLRDLYRLTEAALHGGRSDEEGVRAHLAEIANEAKAQLLKDIGGARADVLQAWLDALDDGYWLNHDADALKWHALEVMRARTERAIPHVEARIRETQGVTEVLVYAGDRAGLFASLASAISASGADIVGARVHTSKDGAAFDVFSIQTTGHKPFGLNDPRALETLKQKLTLASLNDQAAPPPAAPSRRNGRVHNRAVGADRQRHHPARYGHRSVGPRPARSAGRSRACLRRGEGLDRQRSHRYVWRTSFRRFLRPGRRGRRANRKSTPHRIGSRQTGRCAPRRRACRPRRSGKGAACCGARLDGALVARYARCISN
jgi:hypothetical protein